MMRAVILAAGVGQRLASVHRLPKIMLRFGGQSLLARHLRLLAHCGIDDVHLCLGYGAEAIEAELESLGAAGRVACRHNPDFEDGSIVSLWTMRDVLWAGDTILFMDGDVLYDHRMLARLIDAKPPDCFLMDRNLRPDDEPVRLCLQEGRLVDIRKRPEMPHDEAGEWIGLARFMPHTAARIAHAAERYIDAGRRGEVYEEAFRDVIQSDQTGGFGIEDVTDLPWVEIDFPQDLASAVNEIFPRLAALPR